MPPLLVPLAPSVRSSAAVSRSIGGGEAGAALLVSPHEPRGQARGRQAGDRLEEFSEPGARQERVDLRVVADELDERLAGRRIHEDQAVGRWHVGQGIRARVDLVAVVADADAVLSHSLVPGHEVAAN